MIWIFNLNFHNVLTFNETIELIKKISRLIDNENSRSPKETEYICWLNMDRTHIFGKFDRIYHRSTWLYPFGIVILPSPHSSTKKIPTSSDCASCFCSVDPVLVRTHSSRLSTASSRLDRLWYHRETTACSSNDKDWLKKQKQKNNTDNIITSEIF